ncbi:GYD domain-containing protein [Chloroflexota bacterium]
MAYYIMLSTLTDEGRKTVMSNPKRIKAVNSEVENMGVTVKAQYALLGQYDFLNILEADNNETIAKMATALGARGTMNTVTLAAMDVDHFIKTLES